MIDKERFINKAKTYNIEINATEAEKFNKYAELLVEWNKKINLTAILSPEGIEDKHFIDSLLLANQPEVKGNLVDVGSGAGFPGVVVQLFKPETKVTLMEPTGKRIVFLQEVSLALGLPCKCVKERAEEAARKAWRESFDVATARAVAALPELCEYCLPLVKPGGFFIAMKGDVDKEIEDAQNAMAKLGGSYKETRKFTLPDGSERTLVVIEKIEATSKVYPRNGGSIAKKPLR